MLDEAGRIPSVNSSTLLPGTWPGGTLTLTVMSVGGSVGAMSQLFVMFVREFVDYVVFMVWERVARTPRKRVNKSRRLQWWYSARAMD
jgi:hypothetical protein